jgi:hypothetical protein
MPAEQLAAQVAATRVAVEVAVADIQQLAAREAGDRMLTAAVPLVVAVAAVVEEVQLAVVVVELAYLVQEPAALVVLTEYMGQVPVEAGVLLEDMVADLFQILVDLAAGLAVVVVGLL